MSVARHADDTYAADALRDLGARGVTYSGHAYAYCARGDHYHYALARDVDDVRDTLSRIRHGKVRLTWAPRTGVVRSQVRASGHAADRRMYRRAIAFGRAFDRTRSYGTDATPSALPCVTRATAATVALSARTTDTLARGNVWGARNDDHDTWARAFDARLAERDRIAYMLNPVSPDA